MLIKTKMKNLALAITIIVSYGCSNEMDEYTLHTEVAAKSLSDESEDAVSMENAYPEPEVRDEINSEYYKLDSARSRQLAGGSTIPRRGRSYELDDYQVPGIVFSDYTDHDVINILKSVSKKILVNSTLASGIMDMGEIFSLKLKNGMAYAARGTGSVAVKDHDYKVGFTEIKNDEEAVNLALDQIASEGLLTMAENESLDVRSVQSTYHAGWFKEEGKLAPVYYENEQTGELTTKFKSAYTVNFGRRYYDIPIMGPSLTVRLDATGRMVAYIKGWRNIKGEADKAVNIMSDSDINRKRDSKLAMNLPLKSVKCGYVEASSIATYQRSPGLGCRYTYRNPEHAGTLNEEAEELINIAVDKSLKLKGQSVVYKSEDNELESDGQSIRKDEEPY